MAQAMAAADVLRFVAGGEAFAMAAGDVTEIVRPRATTRVPHAPASLIGVLNLRGAVLPVVSAAALLGRAAPPPSQAARVVVVDRGAGGLVGLMVDSVASLRRCDGERLVDLGALLAKDFRGLARGAARRGSTDAAAPHTAAAETQAAQSLPLIIFTLAGQDFALRLGDVSEVTALPADIIALPGTDDAMLGAAGWRGQVLPVVSLRVLLGLPAAFDRSRARLVITQFAGMHVGLAVDAMRAILRVPPSQIDPVPPVLTRGAGEAQIEAIVRAEGGLRLTAILSPQTVFAAATAARLLDKAAAHAEETTPMPSAGTTQQFVVFLLDGEPYGLPIAAVDEVVRRPDHVTRVPRAPDFLEGVINLRGRAVPLINQRRRFALPDGEGRQRRVVVVTIEGLQAGFVVDSVSDVLSVHEAELQPAPAWQQDAPGRGPGGTGLDMFDRVAMVERSGRMILLVNPKALLDGAERDLLAAIAAAQVGTPAGAAIAS